MAEKLTERSLYVLNKQKSTWFAVKYGCRFIVEALRALEPQAKQPGINNQMQVADIWTLIIPVRSTSNPAEAYERDC